jgi:hypothetical protein
MENNPQDVDQAKYLDNAIRAVQQKKPLPEIDFTLHTMEDGTQVSTMERVCKGTVATSASERHIARKRLAATHNQLRASADPTVTLRRPSSRLQPAHRRAVFFAAGSLQAQYPIPQAALLP